MNPRPIETATDTDLRLSRVAMQRAALRARQVAMQTGTALVISRAGVIETIEFPRPASVPGARVQEPDAPYGDKP